MERDARQRAEALDRFWDDLVADDAAERPPDVDEVYAATMRRVNTLGDVPGLEQARNRIWQNLTQPSAATEQSPTRDTGPYPVVLPPSGMNGRAAPHPGLPQPPPVAPRHPRWASAHWAVAALLVLTTVAAIVVLAQGRFRPEAIVMTAPNFMGRFESQWQTTGGDEPLAYPQGLTVDPEGNIWVVDGGNDRFQIFAPDGNYLEAWGASGSDEGEFAFSVPEGSADARGAGYRGDIAFDDAGNFYVVDTGNHRVQKFAPDRSFLFAWGSEGEDDGEFLTPVSVAIGPDGSVYVCDADRHDIQKFDAEGRFLGVFGQYELDDGNPSTAASVAVDGQGFVWVADHANNRIARFSPDGAFLDAWGVRGTRPGELLNPRDLTIDGAGLIYVIDSNVHRIQLFAPNGRFLAETRSNPTNPESFTAPQAIALGRDGTVFISDDFSVHALRVVEHLGDALMPWAGARSVANGKFRGGSSDEPRQSPGAGGQFRGPRAAPPRLGGDGCDTAREFRRADTARARRARAPCPALLQCGNRRPALHRHPHRRVPRRQHPRQARRAQPARSRRTRVPGRAWPPAPPPTPPGARAGRRSHDPGTGQSSVARSTSARDAWRAVRHHATPCCVPRQ